MVVKTVPAHPDRHQPDKGQRQRDQQPGEFIAIGLQLVKGEAGVRDHLFGALVERLVEPKPAGFGFAVIAQPTLATVARSDASFVINRRAGCREGNAVAFHFKFVQLCRQFLVFPRFQLGGF